jgi:hypothetical protein
VPVAFVAEIEESCCFSEDVSLARNEGEEARLFVLPALGEGLRHGQKAVLHVEGWGLSKRWVKLDIIWATAHVEVGLRLATATTT